MQSPSQSSSPSLVRRAILALLLTVGFYGLALVIIGILLAIPYAEIRYTDRIHLRLAARTAGATALIEGLKTVHRVGGAFRAYMQNEFLPVIWEASLSEYADALAGVTVASLPTFLQSPDPLVARVREVADGSIADEDIGRAVLTITGRALAVALVRKK